MEVERFEDIEEEVHGPRAVDDLVQCVDDRSQESSERRTGWILTHRDSHKAKHLERNPYVSLSYIRGDVQRPLYVDCTATWVAHASERERIWNLASSEPAPLGFDPAPDFVSPANPNFGVLQLTPWRIVVVTFPAKSHDAGHRVWREKTVG